MIYRDDVTQPTVPTRNHERRRNAANPHESQQQNHRALMRDIDEQRYQSNRDPSQIRDRVRHDHDRLPHLQPLDHDDRDYLQSLRNERNSRQNTDVEVRRAHQKRERGDETARNKAFSASSSEHLLVHRRVAALSVSVRQTALRLEEIQQCLKLHPNNMSRCN